MIQSIRRRLRTLEACFPEPALDLSGVSTRDLDVLERYFAQQIAKKGSLAAPSRLPPRLQRLVSELDRSTYR
jgi:hypothetical protein